MEFLVEYGLFLAKVATLTVALLFAVAVIAGISLRHRRPRKGELEVAAVHEDVRDERRQLRDALVTRAERRAAHKKEKKEERQQAKKSTPHQGKRLFVLNFNGDLQASAVDQLREEVTALLGQASAEDEVMIRLESGGGMVHSYGLAASQLDRIRRKGVALTVCVDKVAASGGYMMACVANRIVAAPFAMVGSIGVLAQVPNVHRLLRKHDIDFEQITAGEYKRTLTVFGENTEQGREKLREDLEEIHEHFKTFIVEHRPEVDIDRVATGEVWLGTRAQELGLVDELMTSDDYLIAQVDQGVPVYEVCYRKHTPISERLGVAAEQRVDSLLNRWWARLQNWHLWR